MHNIYIYNNFIYICIYVYIIYLYVYLDMYIYTYRMMNVYDFGDPLIYVPRTRLHTRTEIRTRRVENVFSRSGRRRTIRTRKL